MVKGRVEQPIALVGLAPFAYARDKRRNYYASL